MSKRNHTYPLGLMFALASVLTSAISAQNLVVNDERATEGYRLISRLNQHSSRLIDKSGRVVHEWTSNYPLSTLATLQPDGLLLRTCGMGNTVFTAGGGSGRVELLDWDSRVVWSFELNTDTQILHHDVQKLPNGNFLMLVWDRKSREDSIAAGVDPDRVGDKGILFEKLIEVRPNYPSGGEIVWEWSLWDHFVQDVSPDRPNYGDLFSHPELVNVHFSASSGNPDWFHANSIDYNPALDQIAISVRTYSEVWIIDHSTTTEEAASHAGGLRGKGGDLLYRWGNPLVWAAGEDKDRALGYQHNAHWIEPGLPGEGRMLVFTNNDPARPTDSRVVELELPLNGDGSYDRAEGGAFGPAGPAWSYAAETPGEFYSAFISGMQRLPNGNTLICSGFQSTVFEVNPSGEVLWKYNDRNEGEPANVWLFRANWYPAGFPGLGGTPLYERPLTVLQGATTRPGPLAPDSLVLAYGDFAGEPAIEVVDGARAVHQVTPHAVSPGSAALVLPATAAPGAGRVIVRDGSGYSSAAEILIATVAPGLFAANGRGEGVGAFLAVPEGEGEMLEAFVLDPDTQQFVAAPLPAAAVEAGLYLLIPVTGVRQVDVIHDAAITVGKLPVPAVEVNAHPDFPGVDVIKAGPLPAALVSSGVQPVAITAAGKRSNVVTVAFE